MNFNVKVFPFFPNKLKIGSAYADPIFYFSY